jgi:hypothetical protein
MEGAKNVSAGKATCMNEDDIHYKGREKHEDGEYDVFEVDMGDNVEDDDFHMPTGFLLNHEGRTELRYVVLLRIDSPEIMREHLIRILDGHSGNWTSTEFSGDVYLKCWNDLLEPEHMDVVGGVLQQILEWAQGIIDSNGLATADGHRVVLRATLHKHSLEEHEVKELKEYLDAGD